MIVSQVHKLFEVRQNFGKRRMRIAKIPDHTSIEEVKSAIKKQIGDVVCLELDKNGGVTCTVNVSITDKEFHEL